MINKEIKEVKEYIWGAIVTVIEGDKVSTVITAKTSYLAASIILFGTMSFIAGLCLG